MAATTIRFRLLGHFQIQLKWTNIYDSQVVFLGIYIIFVVKCVMFNLQPYILCCGSCWANIRETHLNKIELEFISIVKLMDNLQTAIVRTCRMLVCWWRGDENGWWRRKVVIRRGHHRLKRSITRVDNSRNFTTIISLVDKIKLFAYCFLS